MTVSATSNFNRFTVVPAKAEKPGATLRGVLGVVGAAFEASGRKRAYLYFARKSDAELAQLGLTRALLAERLFG